MKKFLMAIMAVMVLASCAGNVFEQKTKVFNKATEKVSAVQNVDEVEAIIISVEDEINAIEQGEEWKAYEALVEANDTAALKELEAAKCACEEAQNSFILAALAAAIDAEDAE